MSSPPPSIDAPSLPLNHPLSQVSPSAVVSPEALNDPPPPYPTPRVRRTRGTRSNRRISGASQRTQHSQIPSNESDNEPQPQRSPRISLRPLAVEDTDATEVTPLLGNGSPSAPFLRPRSLSQSSMTSFAPSLASLAQTAWAFFSEECDSDDSENGHDVVEPDDAEVENDGRPLRAGQRPRTNPDSSEGSGSGIHTNGGGFFSLQSWARYFRPLSRAVYWRSLTHLVLINFPFALAAWVYLFVFTVTGTTLLILLPLGAILCFFDLLGARAFSRAELFLQTKFHTPLHYPLSVLHATASLRVPSIAVLIANYPIFTRSRIPSASELESGQAVVGEEVIETSFYKNTNSMFTDSTTFQALFYFLVIKPAITLLFLLFFLVICVPLLVLVIPAPMVLRVCRRIGRWQAVVAVEGLIVGVR
ncbi:hypothetical protein BT96DRAFT_1018983 [Gymnopus androsaceus JB14]|uniref:Uncharacterized protein n=1 Tax=Gymnopus androsaceus JB14 TaxID=1447944 RepID=A0A6A4HRE2_9AGAR|nr:hypothetical protein BT96DRAFT_1018983 [Gymnopus androsaceus JB14]